MLPWIRLTSDSLPLLRYPVEVLIVEVKFAIQTITLPTATVITVTVLATAVVVIRGALPRWVSFQAVQVHLGMIESVDIVGVKEREVILKVQGKACLEHQDQASLEFRRGYDSVILIKAMMTLMDIGTVKELVKQCKPDKAMNDEIDT